MSRYNHPKHRGLPDNVRGILMNQTSDKPVHVGEISESKAPRDRSYARDIDRKILVAMNGIMGLPDEHILSFNSIWFNLIEQIGDISRKENIDKNSMVLVEKIMNSEVYLNEAEITSRQDISGRLRQLEELIEEYLD